MAKRNAKGEFEHSAGHHDHPEHHLHHDVHPRHHKDTMEHEHGPHHMLREHHGRGAYQEGARGAPHEDREAGNFGRSGRDASYVEPFLIPDYELLPRDDSGGPEFAPYTAEFGDGGYSTGPKAHLSPRGYSEQPKERDEESNAARRRAE